MKFEWDDIIVIVAGIVCAVWGEYSDIHGLLFSGGALIGAATFRLGYIWEREGDA